FRTAYTPPRTSAIVPSRTMNLFLSEKSMMPLSIVALRSMRLFGHDHLSGHRFAAWPGLRGGFRQRRRFHHWNECHAAFGALARFALSDVVVLRHGTGVVEQLA